MTMTRKTLLAAAGALAIALPAPGEALAPQRIPVGPLFDK